MTQRAKNIVVGITVIVALVILAGLILIFTGLPQFLQRGYEVKMLFEQTSGSRVGDPVYYRDIQVGTLTEIRFSDPNDLTRGVTFTARIDRDVRLPANAKAALFSRGMAGSPYIQLTTDGPLPRDPKTGQLVCLPTDGLAVIRGEHRPSSLLPPEVIQAAENLSTLASKADTLINKLGPAMDSFKDLADRLSALLPAPPPAPAPGSRPADGQASASRPAAPNLTESLAKLCKVIDGLEVMVGDPENQKNLKTALENLARASAQANETLVSLKAFTQEAGASTTTLTARADALMAKLITDADELAGVLAGTRKLLVSLEQGKGTAGKLLTDDQLYNNLLSASQTMTRALQDLQALLKDWRTGGVNVKLK